MLTLGLGIDEDYTLSNAHSFALSYFDHPPLHQWISVISLRVFGYSRWARLPFVILFCLTSWYLYALTTHLFDAVSARWALIAFNLSAFFTISAGGWVVPDGPLLLCLAAAGTEMAWLFFPRAAAVRPWRRWLLMGIWIGLAGLSKYTACLTVVGLFIFVVTSSTQRRWLAHPAPYAAAAVALSLLTPVFVWNAQNQWVSFAFQIGRGLPTGHVALAHVAEMVVGQAGLLLPWVFLPLTIALAGGAGSIRNDERSAFLLSLSLPAIVMFTVVALWGSRGMPHWTMPGWFFVFPLLGAWLARYNSKWPRVWAASSGLAFALLATLAISQASSGWMRRIWPSWFEAGDPTLESFSWQQLGSAAAVTTKRPDFIVATRWMDGAKAAAAFDGKISGPRVLG